MAQWIQGAIATRAGAERTLVEHITAVVGHGKGRMHSWDVVNEAIDDGPEGAMRKSKWREAIGDDYIAKAFEYAHEADPAAELYYNEYNLWKPAKRDAAIALVKKLRAQGLRVDAIGEQAHWGIDDPPLAAIDETIDAASAAKVTLLLTELDVDVLPRDPDQWGADLAKKARIKATTNLYPDGLPPAMQQKLAARYAEIFRSVLRLPGSVSRVTFWGVTDATSWLHDFPIPGRINHPLLWDRNGQPKPAFDAVLEVLKSGRTK
jgi:endo-1,4-beta-xylanase